MYASRVTNHHTVVQSRYYRDLESEDAPELSGSTMTSPSTSSSSSLSQESPSSVPSLFLSPLPLPSSSVPISSPPGSESSGFLFPTCGLSFRGLQRFIF